jgi:hypothetical protein
MLKFSFYLVLSLLGSILAFLSVQAQSDTSNFKNTLIYPSYHSPIIAGKSSIYSASFEMAWVNFKNKILKEPIQLKNKVDWAENLNQLAICENISPQYCLAEVGFGKDNIIQKIKNRLKKEFNVDEISLPKVGKDELLFFSYLKKDVLFFRNFTSTYDDSKLVFNQEKAVNYFGLKRGLNHPTVKEKIKIYDYLNQNDFIFQISTKTEKDELFFAKVKPFNTLIDTYSAVMSRIDSNKIEYFVNQDQLFIPYISFNFTKNYEELIDNQILNQNCKNCLIKRATQTIDFDLNEEGVFLKDYIINEIEMSLDTIKKEPRKFIFDKPFLIIMKEKDKPLPYFLMWVGNSDLMQMDE